MKKRISLLLVFVMLVAAFAATGCSKKEEPKEEAVETEEATEVTEETAEEVTEEEATEETTEVEGPAVKTPGTDVPGDSPEEGVIFINNHKVLISELESTLGSLGFVESTDNVGQRLYTYEGAGYGFYVGGVPSAYVEEGQECSDDVRLSANIQLGVTKIDDEAVTSQPGYRSEPRLSDPSKFKYIIDVGESFVELYPNEQNIIHFIGF